MTVFRILVAVLAVFLGPLHAQSVDFYRDFVRLKQDEIFILEFQSSAVFSPEILDVSIAEIANFTFSENSNSSVGIRGVFLGHTMLELRFTNESGPESAVKQLPVSVLRNSKDSRLTLIFTIIMAVIVFANTFIMGLQLQWKVIVAVVKRPIAPIVGFICQFGLMPLLATGYGFLFLGGAFVLQFGYFAVGCSPGGGPSNMWTLLLDGNLDLSVTMTFFSNVAALGMMPFWLYTLGQIFYAKAAPGQKVKIPFANLAISLVLLICPIFLGILTRHFKPNLAEKSKKIVKFSSLIILIVAIPFGTYANLYLFSLITWRTLACGLALPWTGFTLGYLASWVFRQDHKNRKTVAIETGFQNAAIAVIVMNMSLPKPDGDMAIVMPLCVLIFTPIPMFVLLIIKTIRDRIEKRRKIATEKIDNPAEIQVDDKKAADAEQHDVSVGVQVSINSEEKIETKL